MSWSCGGSDFKATVFKAAVFKAAVFKERLTVSNYLNETFFILLGAVNLSVLCVFLIHKVRTLQEQLSRLQQHQGHDSQRLARQVQGIVARLRQAEQQLQQSARQQREMKSLRQQETDFSQAGKLLDLGIGCDQLTQNFGLSEAEARLMSLLHDSQDRNQAHHADQAGQIGQIESHA